MGTMRSSVGRYLNFSVAATALVTGLPLIVGLVTNLSLDGSPLPAFAAAGSVWLLVVAAGTAFWKRRPESADVSFDELMLWRFFRRARAEEKLNESARALGLDLGGRPLRRTQMSSAQRLKILHSLATALESKDPYTHGHSTRVEHLAARMAKQLALSERDIEDLRTAASLHDVGKIRVPTRILRKPGDLTIEEKLIVQEHASVGAWMVSGVASRRVVMSVRHHHERWDGNGYPDGVGGRDIPLFARIIAVADSFDAMTSTRPYRHSMSRDVAIDEIRLEAGTQFDPVVVNAFLQSQPGRITVPGFVFPGIATALLRKAAGWACRVGSTQVAETAAGAGIAAVVAASVFVPPVAMRQETQSPLSTRPVNVASPIVSDGSDDIVAGKSLKTSQNVVTKKKLDKGDAHKKARATRSLSGGESEVFLDTGSAPPSNGKAPNGPPDSPGPPSNGGGGGEPEPEPAPPALEKTHGDPQPDKGRDCIDHLGQGEGGGNAKHCA